MERLRIKIKLRAGDLNFLKHCRDKKLTPKFAIIKHKMRSSWNKKAFDTLSESLVRAKIRKTCAMLDRLSREALMLHLKLANVIRFDLWNVVDACAAFKASNLECKAHLKQEKKILKLQT